MNKPEWSKPYCNTTHLGRISDPRWSTVTDFGSFAELTKWSRGCGFSPAHATYDTAEQARAAGELWVETGADLQEGLWPAIAA